MISYAKVGVQMCKYFSPKFKTKEQNGSSKSYDRRSARPTRHVTPITALAILDRSVRVQCSPNSPLQPDYNARLTRHVTPITTLAILARSVRVQCSPNSPPQPDYNARLTRHVTPITTLAQLAMSPRSQCSPNSPPQPD